MSTLSNWLLFIVVNGLLVTSSWFAAGALIRDQSQFSLRFVAMGILSFAQATVTVLFLGVVAHYLSLLSVAVFSVVLSSVLIYSCRHTHGQFLRPAREAVAGLFKGADLFLYIVIALFTVQLIILLAKVAWLPPHIWDVFSYHLSPAVAWYQQGYIPMTLESPVNRINGAPLGMTVLAYWFFIFFRDDFLVEMPMLLWALLLVPVVFALLRQAGVDRQWSAKFSIVTFFVPIVLLQAVTVKDHLGLNVSFVAALLFLAAFIQRKNYGLLLLAATALGLLLGYKIAAPIHALVALAVFLVFMYFNQRQLLTDAVERLRLLKTAAVSAALAVIIGGYWYIKNLLVFGSLQGAYGQRFDRAGEQIEAASGTLEAVARTATAGQSSKLLANLKDFFPRIFDAQNVYGADLTFISGFGPQFSAFGLLAMAAVLIAAFRKNLRSQPIYLVAAAAVLLFIVYLFLNHNANSYRILSFMPMALLAYAAVLLHQNGFFQHKKLSLVINVVVLAAVVWVMVALLPPSYTNPRLLKEFIGMDASFRTSAAYTRWFAVERPNFYRLLHEVPADEPLAYVAAHKKITKGDTAEDTWSYLYFDRHWQRRVSYLDMTKYLSDCNERLVCKGTPQLKQAMMEKGISLLSSCKSIVCLKVIDKDLHELAPGFYYLDIRSARPAG